MKNFTVYLLTYYPLLLPLNSHCPCHHSLCFCFWLVFFEVWRDAKIGIMKSVSENIYLKTCTTRFPGAQSDSLHLNSLRACWRSTAAVAQVSISAEADGKCLCCSGAGNTLGKWHFVVVKMTFPDVWKFRILKLCPFKLSDESLFRRYWNINY